MQQRKILLLENVASQGTGVREQLTRAGFQVAVSRYEADGVKRLAEWRPDLVLVSTAHPAGDLVDYCRRVRPLAPGARFVVTSPLNRERLLQEHPGLQQIVDDVLLRPFSHEEAAAALFGSRADRGEAPGALARAGRLVVVLDRDPELAALLHRILEPHGIRVAAVPFERIGAFCDAHRPAVLVLEWPMPPEFIAGPLARIRAGTGAPVAVLLLADSSQESVSSSAPALVRTVDMFFRKPVAWEPFFRVLARHLGVPEIAALRPEEAIVAAAPAPVPPPDPAPEPASDTEELRAEFQRQLEAKFLEVEELRRRLDAATRQGAVAPAGVEWLQSENDQLRQSLNEAERKASLTLATEQLRRSEMEVKLDNLLRMKEDFEFRAQNEIEERTRRIEEMESRCRELEGMREGAERAAAEREAMHAEFERALVEKERLEERLHALESAAPAGAPAADASRLAALEQDASRCRSEAAEAQAAQADARREEDCRREIAVAEERRASLERELSASGERLRASVAEAERLHRLHEERERSLDAEVRTWRGRAESLALEVDLVRAQGAERVGREAKDRRSLEARIAEAETEAREVGERLESLGQAARADREAFQARDEEARVRLAAQQALTAELEQKLAERPAPGAEGGVSKELHRIQELLEEVVSRARTDAVDNARREAEMSARLQDAIEERRLLQERFDRAAADASERERRSATLLQSAIDRGPGAAHGRENLPALVPPDPPPRAARSRALLAGLVVTALLAGAAYLSLRGGALPRAAVPREHPQPAPGPTQSSPPAPSPMGAASTPREVWDRWTRSDSSGGVLVQATLRSEEEVRAEAEAERRARGWTDEQTRADLTRRLGAFRFDSDYYLTVYLKNVAPGYPAYFEDLVGRFRLRDSSGRESGAFLPPGQEKDRRIFTFGAGEPSSRVYEATLPLAFSRAGLSRSPRYLQLVVADVGMATSRVLTWELE